jgi:hypothetical protein
MTIETYTCPKHHVSIEKGTACPQCIEEYLHLPDPQTMTGPEREAEFRLWETVTLPFPLIHKRLEALVGHPIWVHELHHWDDLAKEAGKHRIGDTFQSVDEPAWIPENTIAVIVTPDTVN